MVLGHLTFYPEIDLWRQVRSDIEVKYEEY